MNHWGNFQNWLERVILLVFLTGLTIGVAIGYWYYAK